MKCLVWVLALFMSVQMKWSNHFQTIWRGQSISYTGEVRRGTPSLPTGLLHCYLLPLPWNNYCNVEHVDEGKIIMQWCILSYILVLYSTKKSTRLHVISFYLLFLKRRVKEMFPTFVSFQAIKRTRLTKSFSKWQRASIFLTVSWSWKWAYSN